MVLKRENYRHLATTANSVSHKHFFRKPLASPSEFYQHMTALCPEASRRG